jgi:subtilase family serine protease
MEVRLEGRTGNPVMHLLASDRLPTYGGYYGTYGGVYDTYEDPDLITVANPTNGTYSLAVYADSSGGGYPDATCTVRVHSDIPPLVNFSDNLNTNGGTNVVSGQLADGQSDFYRVLVPATNQNVPVIGWRLDLTQVQGTPKVRVRKDSLPVDGGNGVTAFVTSSALIAPPFLTPGLWYVEVQGQGFTDYTLTSRMFDLERPAWIMPPAGQPVSTPGLTAPEFGDTGTDTNGAPLPGDRGVDLENGQFHYYGVAVPTNDAVLIRTMLEAISGNPDLYIRAGYPPTLTHDQNGNSGSIYERANTGTGTEYGNWVPHDGRYESWLTNGFWYFAVRAAGGANCRYRLHLGSGSVTNLALNGGSLTNQIMAGGDWRYYRVAIPTNAPAHWNVTFSQQQGDVVMYVRDTSPPGNDIYRYGPYADWTSDNKNNGPYPNFDPVGTYDLPTPPLRPGHTYYLGFRAVNDATFSVSSAAVGSFGSPILLPFVNGYSSNAIPAYSALLYQVNVPAGASRWIHSSAHSSDVQVYLEQGTLPYLDSTADWRSSGASNSRLNQSLTNPAGWPWMPDKSYYIVVTNTAAADRSFSITLSGPDLMPTSLAWTNGDAVAGKSLTAIGTVTNRGNDTALAGWYDHVYLSSNATLDAQDALLGSVWRSQSLPPGGSYTWTNTVTLANWPSGNCYLILKADGWDGVFEGIETNNDLAVPINVTAPDLAPTQLAWTNGEVVAGRPLTILGAVTNIGNGTALPTWYDYVYLSSNATWDAQDTYLGQTTRSQPVAAGAGYGWTNTVTLPSWQPGGYHLIVRTDANGNLFEGDESNNAAAFPVTLTAPDLAPTNLVWTNSQVIANRSLTILCTVTNIGNGTALPTWYDYVYLSSNATWDAQDTYLGYVTRSQPVAAGAGHTWTNTMTLPSWQPGAYYLIVKADYGSAVFEISETNNEIARPITLTAPDLAPTNLVWTNSQVIANRSLTILCTVTNVGNGTALPTWYDYVYLSSNATWDAQDTYLGYVTRSQPVAAGAGYTWTNTVTIPSWLPGSYYLIVKADNDNSVFESNESNNIVAFPVTVTIPNPPPNDMFANRIGLHGLHVAVTGLNVNATAEAGEPAYVNRGHSVWWTWTAPFNGVVTNSTTGSGFDTVLGVYTGSTLVTLGIVAQDDDSGGGGGASRVIFTAVTGTPYQIAVDGFGGASGAISLNLDAAGAPRFTSCARMTNGYMRLGAETGWGLTNQIQSCTNLMNAQWAAWTNVCSVTGTVDVIHANATNYPRLFYQLTVP